MSKGKMPALYMIVPQGDYQPMAVLGYVDKERALQSCPCDYQIVKYLPAPRVSKKRKATGRKGARR